MLVGQRKNRPKAAQIDCKPLEGFWFYFVRDLI